MIHRLYREATKFHNGAHVKDLSALNRDLKTVRCVLDAYATARRKTHVSCLDVVLFACLLRAVHL